ncbi:uncharacterized protein [Pyrus communis]|uniref:uncharacterized protein n=1 Tax=Pyrus communis TaxID=23211 RepID=UPI0035BFD2EB
MRREDKESDEEDKVWRNTTYMAAMAGVMACESTEIYKDEYIYEPNQVDLDRLLHKVEDRDFLSMIRSLDCMHWQWKNCPTRWQECFSGRSRKPTIVLEAVASFDTWIWHAFFGVLGSQNDITVLRRSPIFNNLREGKSPQLDYYIKEHQYNMGYYLADGIYPKWVTLVQAIGNPVNDAQRWFTLHQEAYRKDVERAFNILQAWCKIIKEPARGWSQEKLNSIMMSCIILHNMIMEDERDGYIDGEFDDNQDDPNRSRKASAKIYDGPNLPLDLITGNISLIKYMRRHRMIRLHATNKYLQQDLVPHLWAKRSMEWAFKFFAVKCFSF